MSTTTEEPEVVTATVVPDATSTDVAAHGTASVSVSFSDEQVAIIRDTVCRPKERPATDAEVGLFLARCQRTGLDPMSGQIHAVFRKQKGVEKMTIQVGIDGLRLTAHRTGAFAGTTIEWCGPDGQWVDVWLANEAPKAARCTARRIVQGRIVEQPAVGLWSEYAATFPDGNPQQMWKDKPALMLAKCAEALALRKAFPAELSGLYTGDEMHRAEDATPAAPVAPVVSVEPEPWAMSADTDQLRDAASAALEAIGIEGDDQAPYGRALLGHVKAATGGKLPAIAVTVLLSLAEAQQAFFADTAAAREAENAAARDSGGDDAQPAKTEGTLPGVSEPPYPDAPSDPYDVGA